ncbi:hypothetical protein M0R45_006428 [Rubus argutus]|uniref:F-box protein n=1 Tax=Rubus argutus TaxID=59490 RepID=A0AAW1YR26_RUBAR
MIALRSCNEAPSSSCDDNCRAQEFGEALEMFLGAGVVSGYRSMPFTHGALHCASFWMLISSKFDMSVMKGYGIQDSWTKSVVIENSCPMELSFDSYEPFIFLCNGEILMFNGDDPRVVVYYNQGAEFQGN